MFGMNDGVEHKQVNYSIPAMNRNAIVGVVDSQGHTNYEILYS